MFPKNNYCLLHSAEFNELPMKETKINLCWTTCPKTRPKYGNLIMSWTQIQLIQTSPEFSLKTDYVFMIRLLNKMIGDQNRTAFGLTLQIYSYNIETKPKNRGSEFTDMEEVSCICIELSDQLYNMLFPFIAVSQTHMGRNKRGRCTYGMGLSCL